MTADPWAQARATADVAGWRAPLMTPVKCGEPESARAMPVLLAALLVVAPIFVWHTGSQLPTTVASHFDAAGVANGNLPRSTYLGLMMSLVVGVPLVVALGGRIVRLMPPRFVNLPHRHYWLAPERKDSTAAELGERSLVLALAVLLFLCFVHWLVVQANLQPQRQLANHWFYGGLAVFMGVVVGWVALLQRRFSRVP